MSINNIPTFYDGLQYAAYEPQTDYIEYLIGLNKGTTGPAGPTGPSGGGTASTWIEDNLIQAPPVIEYGEPIRQSTVVYIPWTNYDQINAGFIGYLPLANEFEASIYNDGLTSPYEINVTVSAPYNVDQEDGPNGQIQARGLSGVVLYKTNGTNAIADVQFPGEPTSRRVYVYYNVVLDEIDMNTMISNYLNYYDGANTATLEFEGYKVSNGPSAVRYPTIAIPTGSTGATFSWTAPEYVDEGDTSSTLTITDYRITYGTTGSTYRYPEPIAQDPLTINTGNPNLSYAASGLYPDSPYTYTIYAFNSADIISATGATAAPQYTSHLTPSPLGSLSFTDRYYLAPNNISLYRIGGLTPINTLVNNSAPWPSSSFVAPIQNVSTRGNRDLTATMTLTANLNNSGPSVNFGGFGSTNPGPSTVVNNVTINPTSITDNYASSPNQFFKGFYQNANVMVTIGTGSFGVTGSQYNLVVTDSSSVTTRTFSYYYDGISVNPTGTTNYTIGTVTQTQVSGINVMGSVGTTLETTSTINNMGTYFYRNPYLSMTSALCPTANAVLGDITSGYTGQSFTTGTIGVTKTMATNSFLTTYTNSISLSSSIAYNASGSGNMTRSPASISVVIDGPSYDLIRNIIPTVIPVVTSSGATGTIGCRCYSGTVPPGGTSGTPYFTYNNSGTTGSSYSQILYDQSWNIASTTGGRGVYDTTAEIIVANGGFSSATGPAGVAGPYKNYSIYYNNSLDYSGITTSGYRYATFVWKIAPRIESYSALHLILNNVVSSGIVFNQLNNVASIGGLDLQVFYRFENSANSVTLIPTETEIPTTNFTTVWANANSVGTPFTAGNYFSGTYNDVKDGLLGTIGTSNSSLNFDVSIPPFIITVETEYLYCRVGLPMNRQISYRSVSALLT